MELELKYETNFDKIIGLTKAIEKEILSDISGFWNTCENIVSGALTKRFQSENRGRWAALSSRYKAWKERKYPGRPILQLTQKLFRAATQKGTTGNVCTETPTSLTWGVDTEYIPWAGYVQGMRPSRIWCELESEDNQKIQNSFAVWLNKALDKVCQRVTK